MLNIDLSGNITEHDSEKYTEYWRYKESKKRDPHPNAGPIKITKNECLTEYTHLMGMELAQLHLMFLHQVH